MLDVCSGHQTYPRMIHSPRRERSNRGLKRHRADTQAAIHHLAQGSSKYQNPVRNPYGLLPRPPQTQAAQFKRPYRK
jgi:hypothetical protein